MQNAISETNNRVSHLVVTWMLMIPLVSFASSGKFWFQYVYSNSLLSARYGTLVIGSHFWQTFTVDAVVFSIICISIATRMQTIVKLVWQDRIFAILAIFALASISWSQSSISSLGSAFLYILDTLFVFYLFSRFSAEQRIRLLLILGWICLALSIILSLWFPDYGIDHTQQNGEWKGIYGQKNMCAMATLYMLPAAFCVPAGTFVIKLSRIIYILMSIFLIIMSQSKSSLVAMILLPLFLIAIGLLYRFNEKTRVVLSLLMIITALLLATTAISCSDKIVYLLGRDTTLTGRTGIWKGVLVSVMKHPFLGYGYRAFWGGYSGESANVSFASNGAVTSAHNGLLEVWLDLGVVGVGLVLCAVVRSLLDASVCVFFRQSGYIKWCACIVILTIITSLDEGELMIPNNLIWAMFMLACVSLSVDAKSIRLGIKE